MITQRQKKVVQLDHNMRQSRAEEKILGGKGGNVAYPTMGNAQQTRGQCPSQNNGTWRRNWVPRGGQKNQRRTIPQLTRGEREPEAMAVDRGQTGEDQRYFNCGSFGHIAQNCNSRRIVKRNGKMI